MYRAVPQNAALRMTIQTRNANNNYTITKGPSMNIMCISRNNVNTDFAPPPNSLFRLAIQIFSLALGSAPLYCKIERYSMTWRSCDLGQGRYNFFYFPLILHFNPFFLIRVRNRSWLLESTDDMTDLIVILINPQIGKSDFTEHLYLPG
jgi:hypothetical protein